MGENAHPDLRILQANERTFLAWTRTGLALIAFGFALARIAVWLEDSAPSGPPGRSTAPIVAIGVVLVVVGAFVPAFFAVRHARIREAIIRGEPIIPSGRPNAALAGLLLVAGLGLAAWLTLG
jgi:putative membrane protein